MAEVYRKGDSSKTTIDEPQTPEIAPALRTGTPLGNDRLGEKIERIVRREIDQARRCMSAGLTPEPKGADRQDEGEYRLRGLRPL